MRSKRFGWILIAGAVFVVLAMLVACPPPKPPRVEEDPFNEVREVLVDRYLEDVSFRVSELPENAFSYEPIDPGRKPDDVEPIQPDRVHPVLVEWMKTDPEAVVPVIIVLADDVQIPRFPDLPLGYKRDSAHGEELGREAEELIDDLLGQRLADTERFIAEAAKYEVELALKEQFWLIDAFLTEIVVKQVENLLATNEMTYIQPQFAGEEDPYFNLGLTSGYMGLLDTGTHPTHDLLSSPSNLDYIRDCVHGGADCNDSSTPGWSPNDTYWNHGTCTAAIMAGNNEMGNTRRGVTAITLDSWQIYTNGGLDSGAAVRAFQRGIAVYDRVFIGEMQAGEGENGAIALAADAAYDAGAVVVAANGNAGPGASTVRSPGIAHKVLGIGAYKVDTQAQYGNQGEGPAPDGRYKPDLQAPNETETASNASNTALKTFGGTSGATPYGAGAAALMRNWLRDHGTYDNGAVYAHMINSGTLAWPNYDNVRGVGQLRMPVNGWVWWGKVSISQGTLVNINLNIGSGASDMRASLWWPEGQTEQHDDIDIHLIDPGGTEKARGYSGVSIFERARVEGTLASGTWTVRIRGYSVPSGPQTVFWVVDVHS